MSYKLLNESKIDRNVFGYGDSLTIEFDAEKCVLRISVFENNHFKDDVNIFLADYLSAKTKNVINFLLDAFEEEHMGMSSEYENYTPNDVTKYKKKSRKKGLPRADHKHAYETVLLHRKVEKCVFQGQGGKYETDFLISPTKVCMVCGKIGQRDKDPKYYIMKGTNIPKVFCSELSEDAIKLQKWYTNDYWDKFAFKKDNSLQNGVDVNGSCE